MNGSLENPGSLKSRTKKVLAIDMGSRLSKSPKNFFSRGKLTLVFFCMFLNTVKYSLASIN